MSIEKIYYEFSKGLDDQYYMDLASREVLVVPLLIDIMFESSTNSRWAENLIEKISEKNPRIVYPYFNYISQAFDKTNVFISWNVWKIISNILECDSDNLWENVRLKYFKALNSNMIAEFSIVCDCARKVIAYKPEEKDKICKTLVHIDEREFVVAGEISPQSLEVAKEKVQNLFLEINAE